jgi:hypothetical protein
MTASPDPASIRAAAERTARIVLIAGLAPVIPGAGIIIWQVGYAAHPPDVALGWIAAAITAALVVAAQLYLPNQDEGVRPALVRC